MRYVLALGLFSVIFGLCQPPVSAGIQKIGEWPVFTGDRYANHSIQSIARRGSFLYAADSGHGLRVFSICANGALRSVALDSDYEAAQKIVIEGNTGLILLNRSSRGQTLHNELVVVDLSDPISPSVLSRIDVHTEFSSSYHENDIILEDGIAYVGGHNRFFIVDVSNPVSPKVCANVVTSDFKTFSLNGDMLYSTSNRAAFDVSDPADPVPWDYQSLVPDFPYGEYTVIDPFDGVVEESISPTPFRELVFQDGFAYFLANPSYYDADTLVTPLPDGGFKVADAFYVYDVSQSPWRFVDAHQEFYRWDSSAYFELFGDVAVVDIWGRFGVFDLSTPSAPVPLGAENTEYSGNRGDFGIKDFELVGNLLYVAKGGDWGREALEGYFVDNVDPIISNLADWRLFHFPELQETAGIEESIWGDDADPDEDGVTNSQEYALGLHPRVPDAPTLDFFEENGVLFIECWLGPEATDTDALSIFQASDLLNWSELDVEHSTIVIDPIGNAKRVRIPINSSGYLFFKAAP